MSLQVRQQYQDARTPLGDEARHAFAEVIGADGASLLDAIYEAEVPIFLREIPDVEILRQVWVQNYTWIDGKISWRSSENIPPASRYIGSPYDVEAHYSKKRSTTWVGYKVHLTETSEKEAPHLITHLETTSAPVSDDARTARIHEALKRRALARAAYCGYGVCRCQAARDSQRAKRQALMPASS